MILCRIWAAHCAGWRGYWRSCRLSWNAAPEAFEGYVRWWNGRAWFVERCLSLSEYKQMLSMLKEGAAKGEGYLCGILSDRWAN